MKSRYYKRMRSVAGSTAQQWEGNMPLAAKGGPHGHIPRLIGQLRA
jgi:hypothetical protein